MKRFVSTAALALSVAAAPVQAQEFDPLTDFVAGRVATVCLAKAGIITVQEGIDMELKAARSKNYLSQYANFNKASSGDGWVALTVKRQIEAGGGCPAIVDRARKNVIRKTAPSYQL